MYCFSSSLKCNVVDFPVLSSTHDVGRLFGDEPFDYQRAEILPDVPSFDPNCLRYARLSNLQRSPAIIATMISIAVCRKVN
jgi:hypothetical protein